MRLEILRMKITRIRLSMGNAQPVKNFNGIYAAISFVLPGDVYGTTTYYMNIGYGDCVAVSRDGTMTVQPSSLLGRTSPRHTTSILRRTSTAQQIAAAVTMPSMYCWMCEEKRSQKRNVGCMNADFKPKSIFAQAEETKVFDTLSIAVAKDLKCICATSQTRQCKDKPSFKGRVCCGERVY